MVPFLMIFLGDFLMTIYILYNISVSFDFELLFLSVILGWGDSLSGCIVLPLHEGTEGNSLKALLLLRNIRERAIRYRRK